MLNQRFVVRYTNNAAVSGGEGSALGGGLSLFLNDRVSGAQLSSTNSLFRNNSIITSSSQEGSCLGGGVSFFINSQVRRKILGVVAWFSAVAQVDRVQAQFVGLVAFLNSADDTGSEGLSYGGGASMFFNENQHDNPGASITQCNITLNTATKCPNVFSEFTCT